MKKMVLTVFSVFLVLAVAVAPGLAAPISSTSSTAGKLGSTITNNHPFFSSAYDSDFESYYTQAFSRSTALSLGGYAEVDFIDYSGAGLIASSFASSTHTFQVVDAGLALIDFAWFGELGADGPAEARYSVNLSHSLSRAHRFGFMDAGPGANNSYFFDNVRFDEFEEVEGFERLRMWFGEDDIGTTFNLTMTLETSAFSLFPLIEAEGGAYADFFNSLNATYSPNLQVVPVPPSVLLLFSGFAGLLGVKRWRSR